MIQHVTISFVCGLGPFWLKPMFCMARLGVSVVSSSREERQYIVPVIHPQHDPNLPWSFQFEKSQVRVTTEGYCPYSVIISLHIHDIHIEQIRQRCRHAKAAQVRICRLDEGHDAALTHQKPSNAPSRRQLSIAAYQRKLQSGPAHPPT